MKQHKHIGTGQPSGNSHDRRKARRRAYFERLSQFSEGGEVKILTADYGKRYKGTKATILEVLEEGFKVSAYRRIAPLVVNSEHVEIVA